MNVLNDKGIKALRPLLGTIYKFNIPFKSALKLFQTLILPILLYNTENWNIISDTFLNKLNKDNFFSWILNSKTDTTHRKLLKNILGVTKTCPDVAVYGETGEFPLSLKGLRITLNFWYRVTNLPESTLAKKALLENISIRSNWIKTIEKLIGILDLSDKIENPKKFNICTKNALENGFTEHWKNSLNDPGNSRLQFYRKLKNHFETKKYLECTNFHQRRSLTKLKCSDHTLEIEKGRHRKIPRKDRKCFFCPTDTIEDEEHFLFYCPKFEHIRREFGIQATVPLHNVFQDDFDKLAKFTNKAFEYRKEEIGKKYERVGFLGDFSSCHIFVLFLAARSASIAIMQDYSLCYLCLFSVVLSFLKCK